MGFYIKDLYLSADSNKSEGEKNLKYENTDVIVSVELSDKRSHKNTLKFAASFFAYDNIEELKSRHSKTGDYLNGKYFCFKNMLLIDDCSIENIREVVEHLIEEGDFQQIFSKL